MIQGLVAAILVLAGALVGVYWRGEAMTGLCREAAAKEAAAYAEERARTMLEIGELKATVERQNGEIERIQSAAKTAGTAAANRALTALTSPRAPVSGSGPEVMNGWLE